MKPRGAWSLWGNASLRLKLALAVALVTALGMWLLTDQLLRGLRQRYQEATEEAMIDTANLLAVAVEQDGSMDGLPDTRRLAAIFAAAQARHLDARIYGHRKMRLELGAYLTDAKGMVLWHATDPTQVGRDYGRWNDVLRTMRGEYGARASRLVAGDPDSAVLHVAAPVRRDGRLVGVLSVFKEAGSTIPLETAARTAAISAGVVVASASAILAALVTWWISWPIHRLRRWSREVAAGKRPLPPRLGSGEIAEVGADLARLAGEIDGRAYIQGYVQNLTHELKGPLASIRAAGELLAEDADRPPRNAAGRMPDEERRRFVANVLAESSRIQALVEALLTLAALERRDRPLDSAEFAVAALVDELRATYATQAERQQITLDFSSASGLLLVGDRFLIRLACDNLLRNALAFAPAGSPVTCAFSVADGRIACTVRDRGPGIPAFALDRLGERFFSLAHPVTGRKGSGLGLAIVREVASQHGGRFMIGNHPDGGAEARLLLPGRLAIDP